MILCHFLFELLVLEGLDGVRFDRKYLVGEIITDVPKIVIRPQLFFQFE